tara:strand:- start:249 stop:506 length:258 start_codon:yes stop_codon:yes gene_type:complete
MAEISDRRIQLRESIHQMVVSAANARGVSPASFVSMVVYEHLAARNIHPVTIPSHSGNAPAPTRTLDYDDANLEMDEDGYMRPKK